MRSKVDSKREQNIYTISVFQVNGVEDGLSVLLVSEFEEEDGSNFFNDGLSLSFEDGGHLLKKLATLGHLIKI